MIVAGKPLLQVRSFGYPRTGVTDRLPLLADYGTCSVGIMMFDLNKRIKMTYAEIYAELLGPEGLLKECLGPKVPAEDALGGQTVLGPQNMLIADITGLPDAPAHQESR